MTSINVAGNFEGNLVVGDNNFVVNTNHGTIVRQEALSTQRRGLTPQPPAEPEGFVGRERELKQIDQWIAQKKAVIVAGIDGIGKTSLIKQAANSESARSQPDGVVFLEGLDEDGELLEFGDQVQRLFDALFESQPPVKVDLTSARTYLSNTRPLVLLNSIALSVQNLSQLQNLFGEAPIIIATENAALMRGRQYGISLGPLDREASLTLLTNLTSIDDQETLGQIAALLENVPAALSLVADAIRVSGLSEEDALERLQAYTPREQNKARAAVERAFQLVYSTLSEDERGMVDQVAAAFGVSVDRKWLENEYGGSAVSEKLESLGVLHANSPRLRLMPGFKPLLQQGRDLTKERERLLTHLVGELQTRWNDFEFIRDELGNLLGLLFWAAAQGQWNHVATLGRAIDPYLTLRGLWGAWRKTLGEIQNAAKAMQNPALEGWALHQMGTYEIGMGNLSAARKLLEQAVSIRRKLGDEAGAAYSEHNLQVIAPVVSPPNPFGKLAPWLLGGLALVAIAAFLIFNNSGGSQSPTPEPIVVAPTEVQATASRTETVTATGAPTETQAPSPSPTVTATLTPSPTKLPTITPTYAVLTEVLVNDVAACFYGPGNVYLNKGTRRIAGNPVDLLGRIETDRGVWVYNRFSPPRIDVSDPCWMDARFLDITPEQLMSVKPIDPANPDEYRLPIDYLSAGELLEDPVVTRIARSGDIVTVSWEFFDVGEGQYPNHNERFYRYLVEAWLCRNGEIIFSPSGWGPFGPNVTDGMIVQAQLIDEPGCTELSRARLYIAWAHGYAGPSEIAWPQSETVLQMPTP